MTPRLSGDKAASLRLFTRVSSGWTTRGDQGGQATALARGDGVFTRSTSTTVTCASSPSAVALISRHGSQSLKLNSKRKTHPGFIADVSYDTRVHTLSQRRFNTINCLCGQEGCRDSEWKDSGRGSELKNGQRLEPK